MKSEARQVHIFRLAGGFQAIQQALKPRGVLGVDSPAVTLREKP
jgi:hypothetical protein